MRYWDASALVALIVDEQTTSDREALLREDPQVVTWWASRVECASAINRLHRESGMNEEGLERAMSDLGTLASSWAEVQPTERVRARALRLLRVHPLRAADALQLAAALVVSDENPGALSFVSSDHNLNSAAAKEGFQIL